MSLNPFEYVNSLFTLANDASIRANNGEDIVVLLGPYDAKEFVEEVSRLRGFNLNEMGDVPILGTSCEVGEGKQPGLTLVSSLDEPLFSLKQRCNTMGAALLQAPAGLCRDELSGYGLALMSSSRSESYRSTLLRLSSGICGGSVDCYRSYIESYVSEEGNSTFQNPLTRVKEYGRVHLENIITSHSYNEERLCSFLDFLWALSKNSSFQDAEIQSHFLSAWSQGLCWKLDGIWCPDWAVIEYFESEWFLRSKNSVHVPEREDEKKLMYQLLVRRVGAAETSAMMPVLERYCGCAVAKYNAMAGSSKLERSLQIGEIANSSISNSDEWKRYLNNEVDLDKVRQLRNRLCHLRPFEISTSMLTEFAKALSILGEIERHPYENSARFIFL